MNTFIRDDDANDDPRDRSVAVDLVVADLEQTLSLLVFRFCRRWRRSFRRGRAHDGRLRGGPR